VFLIASIGGDAVVTRIEQIDREIGTVQQSRVNRAGIWESTLEMIRDRPLLGSGFGAYGAAITKYDNANGHFQLEQAHNDYLEILSNGGAVAGVLFLIFAIIVAARLIANLNSSDGFRRACCFGATVGIVGVAIHSFVDFGLHVLVNALVFIALIVIGTSKMERTIERPRRARTVSMLRANERSDYES
jgi:O-antigen ligase